MLALEQLMANFPTLSHVVVRREVAECNGDHEAALRGLLSIIAPPSAPNTTGRTHREAAINADK